jgi:hypothetical protein
MAELTWKSVVMASAALVICGRAGLLIQAILDGVRA